MTRIEIFELNVDGEIDSERPVGTVDVEPGRILVVCADPDREGLLQRLFGKDRLTFEVGDSLQSSSQGTKETLVRILEDDLFGYSLGGRIAS